MNRTKIMTALLAVILCIGLIGGPIAAQDAQPKDMESVLKEILAQADSENLQEELPLYCLSLENGSTIRVMYMEGFDVPNISVSDWTGLLNTVNEALKEELAKDAEPEEELAEDKSDEAEKPAEEAAEIEEEPEEPEFQMEFSAEDSTATIIRKNGSTVIFDNKTSTVEFSDHNTFFQKTDAGYLSDLLGKTGISEDGQSAYLKRNNNSYVRKGDGVLIDLTAYGIKMYQDEEDFYVPMQTLSDLMLSPLGINLYYNGEAVFIAGADAFEDGEGLTELGEAFYSADPGGCSEDLADYSYRELCMVLDHYYGLKDVHRITEFDKLFRETDYQKPLHSTNTKIAEQTLYRLINYLFDDQTSEFLAPSPFSGSDTGFVDMIGAGVSCRNKKELDERFRTARDEAYPEGIPGYEEVEDTAFITIDTFLGLQSDSPDYYTEAPDENAGDTIGLLLYAYRQITREDSPVENVVMDLSYSRGGDLEAAIFAMAFFLGEAEICMTDSLTGAIADDIYQADFNLDRQFSKQDKLPAELDLYCLISPVTSAEGTLTAEAFAGSGMVTMLGQSSGSNSCLAQPQATAYGTSYQIAGYTSLSVMKNGVVHASDDGVETDFTINLPASFYDREAIADFIGSLPFGIAG